METQTENSEIPLNINTRYNTESEGSNADRRILYETSREILNIYCKNYDRPPTIQEIKLFSYKKQNHKVDLYRNCRVKYNTLV